MLDHEIVQVDAVCGADFQQMRAGLAHDIRNPETAANLHKLGAGNDDFFSPGEGGKDKQDRSGVVVYHKTALRAGQAGEELGGMDRPLAAFSVSKVEFQVGIGSGCFKDGL